MGNYWHVSKDLNLRQDYLFYTQFNILLPYVCQRMNWETDEYLSRLDEDFDLEPAMHMAPLFGLNFHKRHCVTDELTCSLHQTGDPRKMDHELPIQIHYLSNKVNIEIATQFTDALLHELSHSGDALLTKRRN